MESDLASGSGRCHNVPLIGSGARRERAARGLVASKSGPLNGHALDPPFQPPHEFT
jgi:hypothetical protein